MKRILVTGGAGFIGSHLVKFLVRKYPEYRIINLDKLTYAGNLSNLKEVENAPNYQFIRRDITNLQELRKVFEEIKITDVIHLAAESHVDRSIEDPTSFVLTNVLGTTNLLICAREFWKNNFQEHIFYHVSTDEVYGSLGAEGLFKEETAYDPRSPYSASKASSDHLVRAFHHTYGLNTVLSNCSNNYGPNQFPEKLIPLVINNILVNRSLPVYGEGLNVRDWLWVEDHIKAIDLIFHKGRSGETYNIGGNAEMRNIDLVHLICDLMDKKLNRDPLSSRKLITYVKDRLGHDLRYAIDFSKLQNELFWSPSVSIEEGMQLTIDWYLDHNDWLRDVTSGEYMKYYQKHYSN
ncbi:MAG: dTDP-glucose 4,6-dehydratase [Saprospiraceae bacterium]